MTSAQAQAFRDAFKQEFEAFKRNEQIKREIKQLRTNLHFMRKNVVKKPVKGKTLSAHNVTAVPKKNKSLVQVEDQAQDYYDEVRASQNDSANVLTLPRIPTSEKKHRRAMSQGNSLPQIFDDSETVPPAQSRNNFDTAMLSQTQPIIVDNADSDSNLATPQKQENAKKHKQFTFSVIKNYTYDSTQAEQRKRELEEQERKELEERRIATNILMHHGVSASTGLQVSRRAAFERKLSSQSVQNVETMVNEYQKELDHWKHRLHLLEQEEVKRLQKESEHREELFNNHGKPKAFFQVPLLQTRARSNSRRFRKLTAQQEADQEELKKREQAKSVQRNSKFALNQSHYDIK